MRHNAHVEPLVWPNRQNSCHRLAWPPDEGEPEPHAGSQMRSPDRGSVSEPGVATSGGVELTAFLSASLAKRLIDTHTYCR